MSCFFNLSTNEDCAQVGELLPHKSVNLYEAPEKFDLFICSQLEPAYTTAAKKERKKRVFPRLSCHSKICPVLRLLEVQGSFGHVLNSTIVCSMLTQIKYAILTFPWL